MKKEKLSRSLFVCAAVFLFLGIIFASVGFYKISAYENSESVFGTHINSYVGGDAYNYIINGTYFAGYCALSGALFVCSVICAVSGLYFRESASDEKKNIEAHKPPVQSVSVPSEVHKPSNDPHIVLSAPPVETSSGDTVSPITLNEHEVTCPVCGRRQPVGRVMCFQCGTPFESSSPSDT